MYYKSLFHINIHHGYFLDKGEEKYLKVSVDDDEMSQEEKEFSLQSYDISDYLKISPSAFTKTQFRNFRMVVRFNASGFRVLVSTLKKAETVYEPIIPLDDEVYLTFELQATDPYFYNYSDGFYLSNRRMYLFTNVEPIGQDAVFEHLFENGGGFIDDRFLLKEAATRDVIKSISLENEGFVTTEAGTASTGKLIQMIENNEDLTNLQKETEIEAILNKAIEQKKRKQVIGYVRLRIKGNAVNQNFLDYDDDDNQSVKVTTPEFTISFVNRKTYWVYKSVTDDATLTTKNKKWLSRNGYIEITSSDFDAGGLDPPDTDPDDYTFPNPTVDLIIEDKDDNTKHYSEIFI
jgi:hypothetical protein